jgi:hypothetical protein
VAEQYASRQEHGAGTEGQAPWWQFTGRPPKIVVAARLLEYVGLPNLDGGPVRPALQLVEYPTTTSQPQTTDEIVERSA